jgi:predicted protein tyrosine phosphatase
MENAHEIIPRLWLGNRGASQDEHFIKSKKINVVFNCTKDIPFSPHIQTKYRVPVDDSLREEDIRNLATWSPEIVYNIMKHYKRGDTILVHCMAGMQRSAASVAMFLILYNRWHAPKAIQYIKSKREIAFSPSANFQKSIDHFDRYAHETLIPFVENKHVTMNNL